MVKSIPCDRCSHEARVQGERFCFTCRDTVVTEMIDAGYLEPRDDDEYDPDADDDKNYLDLVADDADNLVAWGGRVPLRFLTVQERDAYARRI